MTNKLEKLTLHKYFLGTFKAFWKRNLTADHWLREALGSEPSFWSQNNIDEESSALGMEASASSLHYGFGEEATDWFLVKEKLLTSGQCKPVCHFRQMILAPCEGYGSHMPSSSTEPL